MSEAPERREDLEQNDGLYAGAASPVAAQGHVRSTCHGDAVDDVVRGRLLDAILSPAERDRLTDLGIEVARWVEAAVGDAREAAASAHTRVFEEALLRVHFVVLAVRVVLAHPVPRLPPEAPTRTPREAVLLGAFAVTRGSLTVGTAATTAYGVWVMLQSLLDPLREVLTPPVCAGTAGVGATISAFLVARTVHAFKRRIEGRLLDSGRPVGASIREAWSPSTRRRAAPWILLAVLGFDLMSNITSVAALLLIESDRAAQLVEPKARLQERIDAYSDALDGLADGAEAGVTAEVERILTEELDGDSYTAVSGRGKAYYAKAYALRGDDLAKTQLKALARKGVAGAPALFETLEAFHGVHAERQLARRVGAALTAAEREARQALDAAQAELDAVTPSSGLDEAQRRFNSITGSVWHGRGHLDRVEEALEKAKAAVEAETERTDGALRDIAEVVGRVGGIEVAAAAVERLRVELPQVDGEAIELPGLHHRGALELVRYAHGRLGLVPTVAVVVVSVGGSLLASYGEFLFLFLGLGRVFARDRRHRAEVQAWVAAEREAFASSVHGAMAGPPGRVITDAPPERDVVDACVLEAHREAEVRLEAAGGLPPLAGMLATAPTREADRSLAAWKEVAGSLEAVLVLTGAIYARASGIDIGGAREDGASFTVGHHPRPGIADLDAALGDAARGRQECRLDEQLGRLGARAARWSPDEPEVAAHLQAELRVIQARLAALPRTDSTTGLARRAVDLQARLRARAEVGRADLDPSACRVLALEDEIARLEASRREDPDHAALLAAALSHGLEAVGEPGERERLRGRLQSCVAAIAKDQASARRRQEQEREQARRARAGRQARVTSLVDGWAARRRLATDDRRGLVLRELLQDLRLLAPDETSELALYRAAFKLRDLLEADDPRFELVKADLQEIA